MKHLLTILICAGCVAVRGQQIEALMQVMMQQSSSVSCTTNNPIVTIPVGTPRNNFSGNVGMLIQPTNNNITICQLARAVTRTNGVATHTVAIWTASPTSPTTQVTNQIASVTINLSGAASNTVMVASITPVTLSTNQCYVIFSSETSGTPGVVDWWPDEQTVTGNGVTVIESCYTATATVTSGTVFTLQTTGSKAFDSATAYKQ